MLIFFKFVGHWMHVQNNSRETAANLLASTILKCVVAFLFCWILPVQSQSEPSPESPALNSESEIVPESDPSCYQYERDRLDYSAYLSSNERVEELSQLNGKLITKITIVPIEVFDTRIEKEDTRIYRFLNKIHIKTRKGVIESQLLFTEGQYFNLSKITESERILRSRSYLINAFVLPDVICDNTVELKIITRDGWTLQPQTTLSQTGGETKSGFGLSEGNLFGTGNSFTFGYETSQNRNRVFYDFSNPYFLNRPIDFELGYADTSDGEDVIFKLSHPFYSLDSPWAAGVSTNTINIVEKIRQGDVLLDEYKHNSRDSEIFHGFAIDINAQSSSRLLMGLRQESNEFNELDTSNAPVPVDQDIIYPWIGYQYIENKFKVFRNINQIQRTEDISVGANLNVRLGYGNSGADVDEDVIRYQLNYSNVIGVASDHLMTFSLLADGSQYDQHTDLNARVFEGKISYNALIDNKNRWYISFAYSTGDNLAPHQQLTAGGSESLRGYPLDYLRGDELFSTTLERRFFSDTHIFNLIRVGYVAFFDVSRMSGGNNRWSKNDSGIGDSDYIISPGSKILSDVGFGLRLTSSKTHIGKIVHIDIAFPLADRDVVSNYQISLQAQQTF